MNNTKLIALFVMSLVVTPVIAEKPGWAGKGKPTAEQKEAHRAAMEAKGEDMGGEEFGLKEKKEKKEKSTMPSGLEKQRAKKSEKMQNELGKGSDKGKESREENSKKWWKFWEE